MEPALFVLLGIALLLVLQFSRVRRQQRQSQQVQTALQVGAEVLTAAGMVGTVVASDEATVTLSSEDGQRTRWVRAAVVRVLAGDEPISRHHVPAGTEVDGTEDDRTQAAVTQVDPTSVSPAEGGAAGSHPVDLRKHDPVSGDTAPRTDDRGTTP